MLQRISFLLNGQRTELEVPAERTLLHVLRDDLALTGTKEGCGKGHCGTCSVIVNGRIRSSCTLPVSRIAGKKVTTIEGVGTLEDPHPIQLALIEAGAVQCGFCTPAMVLSAKALLDANPSPTREEVVRHLSRNLCRCTGYVKIIEGVLNAAKLLRGEERAEKEAAPHVLGASVIRIDAVKKSLGLSLYGADLRLPGMLHAKVMRSPHAHARILGVNIEEAQKLPGVEAILTAADIPGENVLARAGDKVKDQPFLATEVVRRVGDPVALVAAISEEAAEKALARIKVEYQPLPSIHDPYLALAEEAPKLHPGGNLLHYQRIARGNIEEGWEEADVIVENKYSTTFVEHAYLEPEVAVAHPEPQGRIVVQLPFGQTPFFARDAVANVLGLGPEKVRLQVITTGGSFGGRSDIFLACAPAFLSYQLQRPVRLRYSREESFLVSTKRHPFHLTYQTGASKNGKLTGLKVDILMDTGAYALAGAAVCRHAALHASGPYEIPNVLIEARVVYTNNPMCSTMRGPGVPQVSFAMESQMDILAKRLGLDPLEFRLLNALGPGKKTATGQVLTESMGMRKALEAVQPLYKEIKSRLATSSKAGHWKQGVGLACMWYGMGIKMQQPAQVYLELSREGRVVLYTGAADMGQGITTALGQIVAHELDLPFELITVINADTDLTPPGAYPTASRQSIFSGNAALQAAQALKAVLFKAASEVLEEKPENIKSEKGLFFSSQYPDQTVSLERLAAHCYRYHPEPFKFHGSYDTDLITDLDRETGQGIPFMTYASAAQVALAEVNMETGKVNVLKMIAAQDVGKAINPRDVQGQLEGGIVMGLGLALKEEFVPGKTLNFGQYRIPTMKEIPEIIPIIVEVPEPAGPYGIKGLGECASLATAPAILNAIAQATGARLFRLPATPKRLQEAIRQQAARASL